MQGAPHRGPRADPGRNVVPPSDLVPADGRRTISSVLAVLAALERRAGLRALEKAPGELKRSGKLCKGTNPELEELANARGPHRTSPKVARQRGAARLTGWNRSGVEPLRRKARRPRRADATSRLSPYLRFGCVSPHELLEAPRARRGAVYARQLCWRDFHHQVPPPSRAAAPRLSPSRRQLVATRRPSRPGARAGPGIRSSTPACASSLARATCTTGPG